MPGFPWGAAVSVGASALGALGGDSGLSRRTIRRRTRAHKVPQLARMNLLYDSALQRRTEGLQAIRGAKEASLRETSRTLRTGQRQIAERETQALGATKQSLTSRGLSGTNVAESAERGVRQAADRSMDELFTNFAAFRSGQYAQYASAEAQALEDLGSFYQMRYATEAADYWDPILATLTGVNFQSQRPGMGMDFSGILEPLGQLGEWAGGLLSSDGGSLDLPSGGGGPNLDLPG